LIDFQQFNKGIPSYKFVQVDMAAPELKQLGFLYVVTVKMLEYAATSYAYVKDRATPLKEKFGVAEGYVNSVLSPYSPVVQQKSVDLLIFVDRKVDFIVNNFERLVPSQVKEVYGLAQKSPAVAKELFHVIQEKGVGTTASEYITKYQPVAEAHLLKLWKQLNSLPGFPLMVSLLIPIILHMAMVYNMSLSFGKGLPIPLLEKVPELPLDKIENILKTSAIEEETVASAQAAPAS
jgi:hypothetical protein